MTVLIMILVLGAASLQTPTTTAEDPLDGCSRAKTARAHFSDQAERLRLKSSSDPLAAQTDVLHYRLDFEVDPTARYLSGSNTMTVRTLVDDVTVFRFWLHSALSITAVEVEGKAAQWQRLDTEVIEVSLGRTFVRAQTFRAAGRLRGLACVGRVDVDRLRKPSRHAGGVDALGALVLLHLVAGEGGQSRQGDR